LGFTRCEQSEQRYLDFGETSLGGNEGVDESSPGEHDGDEDGPPHVIAAESVQVATGVDLVDGSNRDGHDGDGHGRHLFALLVALKPSYVKTLNVL